MSGNRGTNISQKKISFRNSVPVSRNDVIVEDDKQYLFIAVTTKILMEKYSYIRHILTTKHRGADEVRILIPCTALRGLRKIQEDGLSNKADREQAERVLTATHQWLKQPNSHVIGQKKEEEKVMPGRRPTSADRTTECCQLYSATFSNIRLLLLTDEAELKKIAASRNINTCNIEELVEILKGDREVLPVSNTNARLPRKISLPSINRNIKKPTETRKEFSSKRLLSLTDQIKAEICSTTESLHETHSLESSYGGKDMGALAVQYRSPQDNQFARIESHYSQQHPPYDPRNYAGRVRISSDDYPQVSELASRTQDVSTNQLSDILDEIRFWKNTLKKEILDVNKETDCLLAQKGRLERALVSTETALHIVSSKLNSRRLSVDLLQECVDLNLLRELDYANNVRDLLSNTLQDAEKQIRLNRDRKEELERDWSDKKEADKLDMFCVALRNENTNEQFQQTSLIQSRQSTLEQFAQKLYSNIARSEHERMASIQLRTLIDNTLQDISRDELEQCDSSNQAFVRRTEQMDDTLFNGRPLLVKRSSKGSATAGCQSGRYCQPEWFEGQNTAQYHSFPDKDTPGHVKMTSSSERREVRLLASRSRDLAEKRLSVRQKKGSVCNRHIYRKSEASGRNVEVGSLHSKTNQRKHQTSGVLLPGAEMSRAGGSGYSSRVTVNNGGSGYSSAYTGAECMEVDDTETLKDYSTGQARHNTTIQNTSADALQPFHNCCGSVTDEHSSNVTDGWSQYCEAFQILYNLRKKFDEEMVGEKTKEERSRVIRNYVTPLSSTFKFYSLLKRCLVQQCRGGDIEGMRAQMYDLAEAMNQVIELEKGVSCVVPYKLFCLLNQLSYRKPVSDVCSRINEHLTHIRQCLEEDEWSQIRLYNA